MLPLQSGRVELMGWLLYAEKHGCPACIQVFVVVVQKPGCLASPGGGFLCPPAGIYFSLIELPEVFRGSCYA